MPKKERSKRAIERAALQKLYRGATLSGLQNLQEIGKLDLREVRKYYTDARAIATKSIQRIQKSSVPFTDEPPFFPKTSELSDSELLRAVADVNRFIQSPTRKLEERKTAYKNLLTNLHEKGLTYLNMEDLKYWDRFRKWMRANNILGKPYASGDILGDIFAQSIKKGRPDSERWSELYEQVKSLLPGRKRRRRSRRRK